MPPTRKAERFQMTPGNEPMRRAGMYRITHLASGKEYIGISTNLAQRMTQHASPKGRHRLANAIRSYGVSMFLFEPLFYCLDGLHDPMFLAELEASRIATHGSIRSGFNILEANGRVGPYGAEFSKTIAAAHARRTPEERSDIVRRAKAAMDPDRKSVIGKANALSKGVFLLSQRMKEAQAKRTTEQKSAAGSLGGKASALVVTTPEQRRARALKSSATKLARTTPQQRQEAFRASTLGQLTREQLSANGSKGVAKANARRTPEERSALASRAAVAAHQSRTPEERRELARKAGIRGGQITAERGAESLSKSSKKAWETRRLLGNASSSEKGGRWINDGTTRKRLKAGAKLPRGWSYGWLLGQAED